MALNINEQARRDANLRLLQRKVDPTIADILGSASHVVLYDFSQQTNAWEKSNVEGSMFLSVRPAGYLLVILNRNSPTNYPIVLTRDFQLQQNDPYLIFKNYENNQTTATIRGIWFPNDNERSQMNDLLSHILQDLRDNKPLPLAAAATSSSLSANLGSPPPVPSSGEVGSSNSAHVDPASATAALLASLNVSVSSSAAGQAAAAVAKAASSPSPTATPNRQPSPSSSSTASGHHHHQQPSLDKKSLQLALLSLIQDERFLDLLHAKYLMVHHARSNRSGGSSGNGSTSNSQEK
jgi:mRNA-decapping enzyme 1B